jgi:hypothetical protein
VLIRFQGAVAGVGRRQGIFIRGHAGTPAPQAARREISRPASVRPRCPAELRLQRRVIISRHSIFFIEICSLFQFCLLGGRK